MTHLYRCAADGLQYVVRMEYDPADHSLSVVVRRHASSAVLTDAQPTLVLKLVDQHGDARLFDVVQAAVAALGLAVPGSMLDQLELDWAFGIRRRPCRHDSTGFHSVDVLRWDAARGAFDGAAVHPDGI